MASLHLTLITNLSNQQLSTFRFNERGGSVGRSQDCDWQLNDAERFISNKHIIIAFVNDHFLVTDTSSNGTYINDNTQPLGKGNSHRLQLNDIIKLGTLSIQVNDIDLMPTQMPLSPSIPTAGFTGDSANISPTDSDLLELVSGSNTSANSAPASHAPRGNQPDEPPSTTQAIGAKPDNLGLFDILSGDISDEASSDVTSPFTSSAPPTSAQSQTPVMSASPTPAASPFSPEGKDSTIPDNWDWDDDQPQESAATATPQPQADEPAATPEPVVVATPITEPPIETPVATPKTESTITTEKHSSQASANSSTATPNTRATTTDTSNNNQDDFFALLYQKLGLPTEYMHTVDKAEFADDLMQVLMTSTQGLMALLAGRSVLKQESRLSMTMIKPQSNNPIKFSLDPSDTLEMLLVKKKPGYLSAQAAYAEAMHDLQLHQMAFLSGLQASLEGVLGELSPDNIEQLAQEKGRGLMDFKGQSRKWDTFANKQQTLQKQVKENLNDVLSRHFSAAYESYISNAKSNH